MNSSPPISLWQWVKWWAYISMWLRLVSYPLRLDRLAVMSSYSFLVTLICIVKNLLISYEQELPMVKYPNSKVCGHTFVTSDFKHSSPYHRCFINASDLLVWPFAIEIRVYVAGRKVDARPTQKLQTNCVHVGEWGLCILYTVLQKFMSDICVFGFLMRSKETARKVSGSVLRCTILIQKKICFLIIYVHKSQHIYQWSF